MRETLHLGTIGRTRVSLNWSVLVVALLVASSLATGVLPTAAPGYGAGAYWATAIAAAVVFFASLLGHELSHAVVARRRGVAVDGIVLWALGGVTKMGSDAADPASELRIGLSGPLASVLFAVVLGLAAWALDAVGLAMLLVAGVAWLAEMNALLAVFNLLPAYPLDGGRVLRAGLWRHWNDRLRATDAAARAGAVIGGLMIALGALGWIAEPALAYDGIWLALVGWFVLGASRSEAAAVRSTSTLDGLLVSDAMVPVASAAPSYATIEDLVGRHLLPNGLQSCPLVELSGEVSGMVSVDDLARVPREHWPVTRAAQVAWPVGSLVAVAPSDALGGAARLLGTRPSHGALVLDRGRVLGTLSLRDLDRVTHARTVVPGGAAPPFAHVGG